MPSTVFDSDIFRDAFGSAAMREIFADQAYLARCTEVEVALAGAQATLGLIPQAAADTIAATADPAAFDWAKLKAETDLVGFPIVGLVHQLQKQAGDAGRFVHWGATTQDIIDTATVLQVRQAVDLMAQDLALMSASLTTLMTRHRATLMAGRTHMQHALPTTFGLKAAVWLSMIERHRSRLEELKPRVLVVQFGGAAGTLASLGTKGLAVQAELALRLGLGTTPVPWHVARDTLAEVVGWLALVTGSLAKIGNDIVLMMQTELAEVFEPFVAGRGASSTMPQKRNPVVSEQMAQAASSVRGDLVLMLESLARSDHERASGPWTLEWMALPRAFIATGGALERAKFLADGLVVDSARMQHNLSLTGGLIVAEAVMMALAPKLGRGPAHDIVYGACRICLASGQKLFDVLRVSTEVQAHMSGAELAALCDAKNYLGSTDAMITRMLDARKS